MDSIQITIRATEEQQEILISQLSELQASGFEQMEESLVAYFPANDFNSYDVSSLLEGFEYNTQTVKEQNWNAVWEGNFQPVVVDDFCAVRADFHEPVNGVEHEILITPKMSFGTGHHATTHMMIQQMRNMDLKGKKVFDFGTGTGILAILAEKLGAAAVSAIDVDDWSIENAKENIERNNCVSIEVTLGSVIPQQQFDVILANINRNVILQYISQLDESLVNEGALLLSGLLVSDEEDIVKACTEAGFSFIRKGERNNWISLLFSKP